MNTKDISSAFTFLYKIGMPIFWITTTFPVVVYLFLGMMHGQDNQPPPEAVKWVALALSIGMLVFMALVPARLKRVRLGNDQLYVSNYVREISVPFTMIKDVKMSRYIKGNPIIIYFHDATPFGDKIMFMPKLHLRFNEWNKPHPVVVELKRLAGLP